MEQDLGDNVADLISILGRIVKSANAHEARQGYAEVDEKLIDEAEAILKWLGADWHVA